MCLNHFFRSILTVILGILGFLLLIFVAVPILVYRQILANVAPCFVKNLGKILPPQSQYFLSFKRRETYNILIWFKLSGKLNVDLVRDKFRTELLFVRNDSGDFVYSELQQYPTMFGGYAFWKWEESFDLDKHIHHMTLDQEADAHAQFERMLQTPLPEKMSPWETTFLEFGDNPDCHFICFKFHHSLCDGEAIFDALMRMTDSEPHRLQFPKEPRAPMIFDGSNLTGVRRFPMSRSFYLRQAKQLRSKVTVSVSMTMLGVLTGAIRRKLENEGKSIPKLMRCLIPISAPSHPKKLTNKVLMVDLALPVDAASGYQRLALLERQAQKERIVKSSLVTYLLFLLNASMPKCWMVPVLPVNTILASIFPGPTEQFYVGGNPVEDMAYALNGGTHALIVNICSYNGNFRYWLGVDAKISSTEQNAEEFVQYLGDELHELIKSESNVTV